MKKKFKVEQSNPNDKGGFVTKLVTEEVIDLGILGKKTKKETMYISTTKQPAVDAEVELDMDMFRIQEYPFVIPEGENEGEEIMLKWLHLK